MLMYLIIILELAFLYAAFWYIYLREPKPRKIVGNPWGNYENAGNGQRITTFGVDPALPVMIDKRPGTRTWQVQNAPAYNNAANLPTFATAHRHADTNVTQAIRNDVLEGKLVAALLTNLKNSVNRLSVKLP